MCCMCVNEEIQIVILKFNKNISVNYYLFHYMSIHTNYSSDLQDLLL